MMVRSSLSVRSLAQHSSLFLMAASLLSLVAGGVAEVRLHEIVIDVQEIGHSSQEPAERKARCAFGTVELSDCCSSASCPPSCEDKWVGMVGGKLCAPSVSCDIVTPFLLVESIYISLSALSPPPTPPFLSYPPQLYAHR